MENFCRLKEIYQFIQKIESEIQVKHSLSVNECMVICSIHRGFRSAGDLAMQIGLSKSRLSKILSGLEKKNYIVREFAEYDKRKTNFILAHSGQLKAKEVEESDIVIPSFILGCNESI